MLTCEQSWCKVPGWVDGIATVKAKADPNTKDSEADEERNHLLGHLIKPLWLILNKARSTDYHLHVPSVSDGADTEQQQGSADHLVHHPAHVGQVGGGEGGEDTGSVRRCAVRSSVMLIPAIRIIRWLTGDDASYQTKASQYTMNTTEEATNAPRY